jgi:glycosidase
MLQNRHRNLPDGWFVPSMPDLNQSNPLVLNYLKQNAIWWIEYADLDGFRVDTYNYSDPLELHLGQKPSLMNTPISIL